MHTEFEHPTTGKKVTVKAGEGSGHRGDPKPIGRIALKQRPRQPRKLTMEEMEQQMRRQLEEAGRSPHVIEDLLEQWRENMVEAMGEKAAA